MAKYLCIFIFLLDASLSAETSIEFRSAAFFHSSNRFREIYGTVGPTFGLEAATTISDRVDGFIDVDWYWQNGSSEGAHDNTRVNIGNLSFGLRVPYRFCDNFTAYAGIGPAFSLIMINNSLDNYYSNKNHNKIAYGGVIKTGILYSLDCHFFLDVFLDYLYQPVRFSRHVDIGGFKLGAGIGYKF